MARICYGFLQLAACVLLLSACAKTSHDDSAHDTTNPGITWVQTSATGDDRCPQKTTTVQDINEAGIAVGAEYVMLSGERPQWGKEKRVRRDYVAENYRVIMLMGDDLGDFIPCTRKNPVHPCTQGATIASREAATRKHQDYWGNGWYILPNPMHGSWTSVK